MAMYIDPATGIELNEITVLRTRLGPAEIAFAKTRLQLGEPRWIVAARLGAHPLTLDRADAAPRKGTKPKGKSLTTSAALRDTRQLHIDALLK